MGSDWIAAKAILPLKAGLSLILHDNYSNYSLLRRCFWLEIPSSPLSTVCINTSFIFQHCLEFCSATNRKQHFPVTECYKRLDWLSHSVTVTYSTLQLNFTSWVLFYSLDWDYMVLLSTDSKHHRNLPTTS